MVFLGAIVVLASGVRADVPAEVGGVDQGLIKREEMKFPVVIDRIRAAAASGAWQKGGWTDSVIDGAVKEWVNQAAKLTGQARPNLPAGLGGLNAGQANGGRQSQVIYVGSGSPELNFVEKSVILVDGNVRIGFAWDCVVVARGAVYISHGDRNVVMAGHYIHVSHDGNHKQGQLQGSLLMSGGVLNVSHAAGSVCHAPWLVSIAHANGATFADSPNVDAGAGPGAANKNIAGLKLPAAPPDADKPLERKVKVVQAVKGNDSGIGAMAVVDHNGVELAVRLGEPIRDGAGKAIVGLEQWKLSFVGDDYALFSTEITDSGFFVAKK